MCQIKQIISTEFVDADGVHVEEINLIINKSATTDNIKYCCRSDKKITQNSWENGANRKHLRRELSLQHQQLCAEFRQFSSGASEWKDELLCCTASLIHLTVLVQSSTPGTHTDTHRSNKTEIFCGNFFTSVLYYLFIMTWDGRRTHLAIQYAVLLAHA